MSRNCIQTVLIAAVAVSVWSACSDTSFAIFRGHRRYPTGNSPTYPNATAPHGGFSSSNGYYSGRSRIADAPPPPAPARPAPAR